MTSKKFAAYFWSTAIGFVAFIIMAFRMNPVDLVTLCQFFFGFQGIITAGFFGFRFSEQWAGKKYLNGK